jgi:glycosyltransferase involved in cell wall biosynthesis
VTDRPLHILHIVPYFYPAWAYGGIPRLAYGLSRALIDLGHRVTVLTTDVYDSSSRLPGGTRDRDLGGIRVLTLPNLSNRLAYRHQAFLPLGTARAFDRIEADPPDVLHLHGHRHLLNNAALRYARARSIPYVLTPNGTLPPIERKVLIKQVFDRWLGGPVVAGAHTIIAVSRAEIAQIRAAGVPASRIALIPNGIDLAEFDPLPAPGTFRSAFGIDGRMVLYLGKLTPRKGVDHLIDAFAGIDRPDVTLVIAGNDMGIEPALRARVEALGARARVRFVGLLTGAQRLAALADAEVLAYPSTLEIFGLVPFEGLLAGAPAVVGDDCGCGELVEAARAGLLVRYGDVRALTVALRQLLDDPARRAEMVERGRRFIRAHMGWQRVAPATVAVYRGALRGTVG